MRACSLHCSSTCLQSPASGHCSASCLTGAVGGWTLSAARWLVPLAPRQNALEAAKQGLSSQITATLLSGLKTSLGPNEGTFGGAEQARTLPLPQVCKPLGGGGRKRDKGSRKRGRGGSLWGMALWEESQGERWLGDELARGAAAQITAKSGTCTLGVHSGYSLGS